MIDAPLPCNLRDTSVLSEQHVVAAEVLARLPRLDLINGGRQRLDDQLGLLGTRCTHKVEVLIE